jgi:DedD protein
MPWPFSRSEPASSAAGPAETGARPNEARDPAAELRVQTRRRLIGAAVLLLAAVIVLPMLLETDPRPLRDDIVITVASPPPAGPARKSEAGGPAVDDKIAEPAPVRPATEAPDTAESVTAKPVPSAAAPEPAAAGPAVPPETSPAAPAAGKEKFVVQVVALSSSTAAADLKARLVKGGFSAYVEDVATSGGRLHRVRVGPFASRDEAQRAIERLRAAGHKAALVGG